MQKIIIGREYPKEVIPLLKNAKENIKIMVYDWRWYENEITSDIQKFNLEIIRAMQRNVKVSVLLNKPCVENTLRKFGGKVKIESNQKTIHAKVIMIDDKLAVIGSHNFTKNAFGINMETSVIIDDTEEIKKLVKFFNNTFI